MLAAVPDSACGANVRPAAGEVSATVRRRTELTEGPRSARRPAVTALHLVALVRAGALFDHGRLVERRGAAAVS
ncbi:hypothetical protein AB0F91_13025 [Amycolatopsis sp. NPDC023774]|uniref:hypothetical protein n=1 Tax=Amycolatopsis sp. NPDC023774 TaxID=3155015 RepID=UPI0033F4BE41